MKVKEVMKRLERLDPEAEVGFDEVGIREINVDQEVRFVSYDGKYPNLCSGTLVLAVGDKEYEFKRICVSDCGRGEKGEWEIDEDEEYGGWPKDFPVELRMKALRVLNDNVEWGHCGGCS